MSVPVFSKILFAKTSCGLDLACVCGPLENTGLCTPLA